MKLRSFITALHAALLCILLAVSPAGSGSMTLLGAGKTAAGGGGSPALTYIGTATPSNAGAIATATGANIGTAAADRLVVVVFTDSTINSDGTTATVTIGGVSATVDTFTNAGGGHFNPFTGIASLTVAAGTTATIVVTYSAGTAGGGGFGIYTITGLSSTTPVGATAAYLDTAISPQSINVATSSGGVVITGAHDYASFNPAVFSGTETYTTDIGNGTGGFDTFGFGHATGTATNASSTVTVTYTGGAASHSTFVAVAWR